MFGRRRRERKQAEEQARVDAQAAEEVGEDGPDGPFDEADAPQDEISRLDLGSVRVPVPDGSQLQVEVGQDDGELRAVHVVTPVGRLTVSAYAAPRTGDMWREIAKELTDQLRGEGHRVVKERGVWGDEVSAEISNEDVALRFVGVNGPRWMLRGVTAGPRESAEDAADMLREILRLTVVVRGQSPMPVRTPLPVELPEAIAQHLQAQQ
ncbi:DUF3710 domain-containing protein [Allokutzneria sp. A3M-2-11 16]|uniref:DUF3710 domain-containing protein n=1 Tax=Allokutzneria sp. A3M-2-11 16 TaxID=2962043 RepID=UPI0020B76BE9|nr:DUF3710 domain-containing protein [Allokutzneria sp. A3M-2-11 16]MCP3804503.1 DUF3710 domain-containing protein [Allokutzneria sp. A3M-2-11 16]